MTITKLTSNIKPLDEVDKINEIIDGVNTNTTSITGKQDTLVSGTNIKTINSESILGSGNLTIDSGSSRNIGEIVASSIPLTDAGLHLLDGSLISGSGIYSDFVDYIASIYDASANYFCSENDWQSAVTSYGVCGKFVYDSVNNTVRLPKYSNKIYTQAMNGSAPVAGNGMTLGILASSGSGTYNTGLYVANTGALANNTAGYGNPVGTGHTGSVGNAVYSAGITTDAANSGLIANLANITTPLDGYYYIVVATSTKTQIEVDIDEIVTDLNGKADVDLSNCTKPHIVETYVNETSWYRVYSDGWCEQGGYVTTNGVAANYLVSFLKHFSNTDYSIFACPIRNDYNQIPIAIPIPSYKSTDSMRVGCGNSTGGFYWSTCGYIS